MSGRKPERLAARAAGLWLAGGNIAATRKHPGVLNDVIARVSAAVLHADGGAGAMTDLYATTTLEAALAGVALVSAFKSWWATRHPSIQAKRGSESRRRFGVVYGFGSVLMLQVVNASEALNGDKVAFSALNLALLFFLCFRCPWSRNKIIELMTRWESSPE